MDSEIRRVAGLLAKATDPEMFAYLSERMAQLLQSNQPQQVPQPIPQPIPQNKPQDNSNVNYGVSKHQPQEIQDTVEYHRKTLELKHKEKTVIISKIKGLASFYLPMKIIDKIQKFVEMELVGKQDSRSIILVTLNKLKDEILNILSNSQPFQDYIKAKTYVQVRFKAYFIHDKEYLTINSISGAKPTFYDTNFRKREYLLQSFNDLPKILAIQNGVILNKMLEFETNGSDWIYQDPIKYQLRVIKYDPAFTNAKGYIPTPEWLLVRDKNGKLIRSRSIIIIKNNDNRCFLKCIYRVFNPTPNRHHEIDIPLDELNRWIQDKHRDISMLSTYEPGELAEFEKRNKIAINIYYIGPDGPEQTEIKYLSIYTHDQSITP
jgi:hypothetical protein